MRILVKTFKGSEDEVTNKVNDVLEKCMGKWGDINDVKCLEHKVEGKEIEVTLLILYSASAVMTGG